MTSQLLHWASDGFRPRPAGMQSEHRLPNICCSSGACREVAYWPVDVPLEGWLQLDAADPQVVHVDLFAFSRQCLGVILMDAVTLQQGSPGILMLQAHGAGLSHRPVRLCWHRPHPQDPQRQIAGLRPDRNQRT
jgi:hypothetical protein